MIPTWMTTNSRFASHENMHDCTVVVTVVYAAVLWNKLPSICLCRQTSAVRFSWMKVAELGGFYWKWNWAPPLPSNRVPFTVIQGKAVIAEHFDCKLAVVDFAIETSYTRILGICLCSGKMRSHVLRHHVKDQDQTVECPQVLRKSQQVGVC